ncbi:NTPCR, partial [Symbiodinium pilosum]
TRINELDFEFIDGGPDLEQQLDSVDSWTALREAVELSLSRQNLDTHLWWRHAADARKRLLDGKSTIRSSEDAADATAVILACARAKVVLEGSWVDVWYCVELADLARAMAAYACVGLPATRPSLDDPVFQEVESQLQHLEVSAHDAAIILCAQRRCGRLSAEVVRDLWRRSMDGRLSELSPILLAA